MREFLTMILGLRLAMGLVAAGMRTAGRGRRREGENSGGEVCPSSAIAALKRQRRARGAALVVGR
jgi:hypothetical protein